MAFRRTFLKHNTHSNKQLNKVCILWKYTEWWASSRSNRFQKNFFKTIYTFKHTVERGMHSVKVQWVMGFNQKQGLSEEVFQNIIHFQTYNWTNMRSVKVQWVVGFEQKQWFSEVNFWHIIHFQTYNWIKYALCESTLSGGLPAEAMAFRRSFFKHYTPSNIQFNEVCGLWKYTEWCASSGTNGFQKKFFMRYYTHSNVQLNKKMRSVKVHWMVGFKQKQWLAEEIFQNFIDIQTYNWTKDALCESTLTGWLQAEAIAFRSYFFETLQTFKHTFEQSLRSVKVQWLVGFKQKQWLSDEFFRSIIHIQTYNWPKYALCESTLTGGLQSEAIAFGRSFSKHYTHSNIQLNEVCTLWKYSEWWASIRSNGSQKKLFKTLYTFKDTIEKTMRSVKVKNIGYCG